tara:strand:+ start:195 stop:332 length:138 start_codon:yes stop_codon:yes gene_type:complete
MRENGVFYGGMAIIPRFWYTAAFIQGKGISDELVPDVLKRLHDAP